MHDSIAEKTEFYQVLTPQYQNPLPGRLLPTTDPEMPQQFLTSQLSELKNEYGDVFTDLGLVGSDGIQFAYEGPFRLSIRYGIIQKMGGTIEVENQVEQGISFLIQLPVNVRQTAKPSTRETTNNI
nr:hypothetical protein [uncultured Desulfobacter sp.]